MNNRDDMNDMEELLQTFRLPEIAALSDDSA